LSIAEDAASIRDEAVLSIAVQKDALLITEDKDFGDLVFRFQMKHHGILLIRIEDPQQKVETAGKTIRNHYLELKGKFSVLDKNKLRIKE
jgi:predicted nuclease of predicted toxin-antitoxin system